MSSPPQPVRVTTSQLRRPAIAIHGGAGRRPGGDDPAVRDRELAGLYRSLDAGWDVLAKAGSALDAAIAAVASMEDSGLFNAGRGAVPTTSGEIETDAGVMGEAAIDGGWLEVAGAVCATTWPANPVRAARAVADAGDALILAGAGADRFASEAGLTRRDDRSMTHSSGAAISEMGTVGAVAVDSDGRLAAATSTGGRRGQPSGRVGDTPVIGAGTWAATGGVAVSATGDGEAFIRAGFAHLIEARVRAGVPTPQAATSALGAVERWRGTGGAIVLTSTGELVVLCDTPAMARGWRGADGARAEILQPGQET